ncbi:universal stress protein [Halolamina sp. C58]|uniref:universal stress protein n=1 Tax=Halolamina sp. C58 TaxID=3421640 RepID=UPI003EBF68B6
MYDHILVPTDGSDHVEPAVEYTLDLAQHYDCTVHALHVVDSSPIERKLELTALDDESLPESWHAAGDDATQRVADRAMTEGFRPRRKFVAASPPARSHRTSTTTTSTS